MIKRQTRVVGADPPQRNRALLWLYVITGMYWLFGSVFCPITLYNGNLVTKTLFGIFIGIDFMVWLYIEAVHGRYLLRKERTYLRTIGTAIFATSFINLTLLIFKPDIAFHFSVLSEVLLSSTVFVYFGIVVWFGGIDGLKYKLT